MDECRAPEDYSSSACPVCTYAQGIHFREDDYAALDVFRQEAERRAFNSLMSYLSPEQQDTIRKKRYFLITGSLGNSYRIDVWGGTYNIRQYNPQTLDILGDYCLSPVLPYLPTWDIYLLQALEFTADEKRARATSNKRVSVRFPNFRELDTFVAAHYVRANKLPS